MMENRGQIHSYDADKTRLRPIFERLRRAGCRNVQTHDAGDKAALAPLKGMMDIVLVDAPCTGTGTWRRHPDAKWRLSETALAERLREQKDVLLEAKDFVKPGGRLIYITCSLLPAENESQIKSFLADHAEFHALPYKACAAKEAADFGNLLSANGDETFLTLSPAKHGTDGFFFAVLEKR